MKRTISLAVLATLLSTTSCNLLNTEPTDFVSPEQYFKTTAQLNAALTAVYDNLGKNNFYASNYQLVFTNNSDEANYSSGSGSNIYSFNPTNSDGNVANLWAQLYSGVDRANLLLANLDQAVNVPDATLRHVEGEARALRAYYYFMLTQWWGDVPLKTTPTTRAEDGQIAFTPSKDVYDFIIAELTTADRLLNDQTASSLTYNERISQTTVEGLLARVCLYAAGFPNNDTRRYAEAAGWARKVRDSGLHSLNPDFTQVFKNMSADAYDNVNRESMWEVGFTINIGYSEQSQTNIGIRNVANVIGQVVPLVSGTGILYKSYQSTVTYSTATPPVPVTDVAQDLRRDWTLANFFYTTATPVTSSSVPTETLLPVAAIWTRDCGKWRRQFEPAPRSTTDSGRNWPLLRYSDVLLMLAEAENEVNGPTATALDAINQVRRRGYGLLLSPAPVPAPPSAAAVNLANLSQSQLRQAIRDERMRELAFEGLRRQDLKRWGILIPTLQSTVSTALNGSTDLLPNGQPRVPAAGATTTATSSTVTTAAAQTNYVFYGANVDASDVLLPIPSVELVNNKLATQNPGY